MVEFAFASLYEVAFQRMFWAQLTVSIANRPKTRPLWCLEMVSPAKLELLLICSLTKGPSTCCNIDTRKKYNTTCSSFVGKSNQP